MKKIDWLKIVILISNQQDAAIVVGKLTIQKSIDMTKD